MLTATKSRFLHTLLVIVTASVFSPFPAFPLFAAYESAAARRLIDDARHEMDSQKLSEARTLFVQALDVAEKEVDHEAESICLGNLGTLADMMDDSELAIHYYKRGYDLALKEKIESLQLKFAVCLVKKYVQTENTAAARRWYDIQMSLPFEKDPFMQFHVLYNQSGVHMLENDVVSALYSLDRARRVVEQYDLGPGAYGSVCMAMGDIMYKTKRYAEAINEYTRGYDSIKKGGDHVQEILATRALYVAYKQINDTAKATAFKKRYLLLNDSVFETNTTRDANERLFDYEKRIDNPLRNIFNRDFILIGISGIFLCIALFATVRFSRLKRNHLKMLESSLFLKARQRAERKEKEAEKLEGLYNELRQKNQRSENPVPPEQRQILLDKINNVMEDVDVICSENFSLNALAKLTGSNTKYVSRLINDTYGKSFKAYLNEFRIREACRRLVDKENYGNLTIRAIHQELGFHTATSFVTAFRKVTGQTPSEFKKAHMSDTDRDDADHATDEELAKTE